MAEYGADDYDDEPCYHEHDEDCLDYQGFWRCEHTHCFNCGGCRCPGYCDDYQTYNLRPAETGGTRTPDSRHEAGPNPSTEGERMSFGFTVAGDGAKVAAQLEAIRDDENQDSLRNAVAGVLAEHVGASELHGYHSEGVHWQSMYIIKASGHSGPASPLSLNVTVETPYIPVVDAAPAETAPAAIDAETPY